MEQHRETATTNHDLAAGPGDFCQESVALPRGMEQRHETAITNHDLPGRRAQSCQVLVAPAWRVERHHATDTEQRAERLAKSIERRAQRLAGTSCDGIEQFFRENYGDLVGFARRRIDHYSAEDAVSDFIVKVLAKGQEPNRQTEDGVEANPYYLAALSDGADARVGLRRIGYRATANNTTSTHRKNSHVEMLTDNPDHSQAAQLELLADDGRFRLTYGSTFEQPEDCVDRVDLDHLRRRSDRTTRQILDDIRYDRGTRQEIAARAGVNRTEAQRLIAKLEARPEVAGPRADAARTKRSNPKKRSGTPTEAS